MNKHSFLKSGAAMWILSALAALCLALGLLLTPRQSTAPGELPPAQAADSAVGSVLSEGGELMQTLTYTRCEHTVTRRLTAPVELYGKGMDEVAALYPEWRITEFSPRQVKMDRQPDLFCPDHMVLMPNGAGYLCVFENKYGDALALVRELDVEMKHLPAAAQEEAEAGIGFSTAEELEQWLEGAES